MHELRLQEQLCDVVLSVSGTKFHAHKVTNGQQIPSTVWPNVNFNVAVQSWLFCFWRQLNKGVLTVTLGL